MKSCSCGYYLQRPTQRTCLRSRSRPLPRFSLPKNVMMAVRFFSSVLKDHFDLRVCSDQLRYINLVILRTLLCFCVSSVHLDVTSVR